MLESATLQVASSTLEKKRQLEQLQAKPMEDQRKLSCQLSVHYGGAERQQLLRESQG